MKNNCGFVDWTELTLVGCNEQWGAFRAGEYHHLFREYFFLGS